MGLGLENPTHLIIIAVVVLLVFGPKRLPEAGKALGKGMRQFKSAISGEDEPEGETKKPLPPESPGPTETTP